MADHDNEFAALAAEAARAGMGDYRNGSACQADRDGDCVWDRCPQERDGEPRASGRHCPLDKPPFRCDDEDI